MAESPRFNRKSFQEWKESRATAPFLQFLEDQRQQMMADWGRGVSMSPNSQVKSLLMLELSTLEWSTVRDFYEIPAEADEETESGAQ
jgi:hypothetical protein